MKKRMGGDHDADDNYELSGDDDEDEEEELAECSKRPNFSSPEIHFNQTSTTVPLALLFSALGEAEPTLVPVLSGSLISKGAFVPVFNSFFLWGAGWGFNGTSSGVVLRPVL